MNACTIRPVVVWLPDAYGARAYAAQLQKGAGHKYIKRVPAGTDPKTGRTRYRYFYAVQHGAGVHNEDHFVEGASFRHEGGHFHVTADHGDEVTVRHDESGKTKRLSKRELAAKLVKHHEKALEEHKAKVTADLATVERHGSDKQKARMREYAKRWGVGGARDTKPATKTHPAGTHEAGHQKVARELSDAVKRSAHTPTPGDMLDERNKAFAAVASGEKTVADLDAEIAAAGISQDKARGLRAASQKISATWGATDEAQMLKVTQRRKDVNEAHSAKVDPHVADKAALEGWQKNDADAITHIHKRAQELLPGVRRQDSHDVVSQHVYGGGVTDAYRERMARENRIVKPAKKVSEDASKPAAGTSTMPEGTRVALHPVGTDYMRGEKGTVMGDSPHLAGHVVVNFDNGKSLVVRAKDLQSTGEAPRKIGPDGYEADQSAETTQRGKDILAKVLRSVTKDALPRTMEPTTFMDKVEEAAQRHRSVGYYAMDDGGALRAAALEHWKQDVLDPGRTGRLSDTAQRYFYEHRDLADRSDSAAPSDPTTAAEALQAAVSASMRSHFLITGEKPNPGQRVHGQANGDIYEVKRHESVGILRSGSNHDTEVENLDRGGLNSANHVHLGLPVEDAVPAAMRRRSNAELEALVERPPVGMTFRNELFAGDIGKLAAAELKRRGSVQKSHGGLAAPLSPSMRMRSFIFGTYLRAYFTLVKGGPVKYIRRVPTGNAKRPWRYIYSETGTAHAAKEGERINLRHRGAHDVVEVRDNQAKLRDSKTGAERTVSLEALHEEIHSIYGAKAERGAARLAAQIVRAAGAPPDGAFKSVKSAWAAYAKRFKAAGVDEGHAKRLVGFLAKRDGWGDDAKAVLLSLATGKKHGAKITASGRQIAQGAENLRAADGAKKVVGAHVVRAVASRLPKGEGDAGQRVEELRAGASGALGKLEGILDAIDAVGESAPKALLDKAMVAAGSEHIQALNDAVKAYPGLHDLPEVAKLHELRGRLTALQEPNAAQDGGKGVRGAYATVYVAGPDGAPMPQAARYRLIEAGDVIASHDPTKGFAQRPEYPEGVQERVYHRDKAEQQKVLGNADKLRPDLVVNTNPDAVNGPPVITPEGVVLGGNSRAMTLQLVHAKASDTANAYKDELRKKAAHFGLAAADIDGMKNPVLVREVQTEAASKEDLGVLVRRYNESFTQAMDPRTDQVARARLVTPKMLQDLASGMDQRKADGSERYPTLNAFLDSNDAKGFVDAMQRAGIVDRRNRSQYLRKDGGLNEDGKTFVERLMVGKVVPHPDTLADMPVSQINAIARSVPHIVRAADSGHDLGPALIEAVQTHVYMRRHNLGDLREFDADQTLGDFAGDGGAGFGEKPKLTPLGRALLGVLIDKPGPVQMSDAFRKVAQHASRNPAGQGGMFGAAKTTAEVVEEAVNPPKVEQASMFASNGPRWSGFGALLAKAIQQDMFGQHVRVDTSHKPTQHGLDFGEPARPKPASDTHPGGTGWQPMPGSKHGGYRRRHGNHWETWYPKAAHHAYPQAGKVKPGAMVRAPDGHMHIVKRVLQHGKTGETMVGVDTPRGPKEWPVSAVKVHREAHEVGGTLGLDKVPQIQLRAGGNFGRLLRGAMFR